MRICMKTGMYMRMGEMKYGEVLPPPLWGRAGVGGTPRGGNRGCGGKAPWFTPSTLPHKGGGNAGARF